MIQLPLRKNIMKYVLKNQENGRLIGNRQKIDRNSKNNPKHLEFLLSVIPVPERSSFHRFFGA